MAVRDVHLPTYEAFRLMVYVDAAPGSAGGKPKPQPRATFDAVQASGSNWSYESSRYEIRPIVQHRINNRQSLRDTLRG